MAKPPRNIFNMEFYDDLDKWQKAYPEDTYILGYRSPDGFFHITQSDSGENISTTREFLNSHEVENGRRPIYEYFAIADIPDRTEPLLD